MPNKTFKQEVEEFMVEQEAKWAALSKVLTTSEQLQIKVVEELTKLINKK